MTIQTVLGATAASLAFAASAQTYSVRHPELPLLGKMEDRVCTDGYYKGFRPGDRILPDPMPSRNVALLVNNECKPMYFEIDPQTGNLIGPASHQRANYGPNGDKPVIGGAVRLTDGWWEKPILATTSQQGITAKPVDNWYCTLNIPGKPALQVPVGSVVIPDKSHAYYLRPTPATPSNNCKPELMIRMPEQNITVSGGGIRNPGNVIVPSGAIPAGAVTAYQPLSVTFGDPIVRALFNLLGKVADLMPAWRKDDCLILSYGMDKADTIRNIRGLTPEQAAMLPIAEAGQCKPCDPYKAGTIGYIGPHTTHDHAPFEAHLHLFKVNQAPSPSCKCFWNPNDPDTVPPVIQREWVNLNGPKFPELTP